MRQAATAPGRNFDDGAIQGRFAGPPGIALAENACLGAAATRSLACGPPLEEDPADQAAATFGGPSRAASVWRVSPVIRAMAGRRTMKQEPLPSSLVTEMLPPISTQSF